MKYKETVRRQFMYIDKDSCTRRLKRQTAVGSLNALAIL